MADSKTKSHGTFVSGFSLGLFLGASGYFMFKTKDGNKLKEKFITEWDDIRVHLAKAGLIPSKDMSVADLATYLMEQGEQSIATQITQKQKSSKKIDTKSPKKKNALKKPVKKPSIKKPKPKKKTQSKKNIFKGV